MAGHSSLLLPAHPTLAYGIIGDSTSRSMVALFHQRIQGAGAPPSSRYVRYCGRSSAGVLNFRLYL
ncbi:uncharacterized protein LAESUDRAFT_720120 [Laetiporus sulphureus 93-53]|uniref:Uncharacterized protein n=1 Tax=Laetiporus sulphureus 93-53 TaxID=1314785 RepID=A0A165HT25_9APHY|nr:uncharacterized protein LAESUDRAFT_720120 [Laetiporus sulphureus 93-53]KZT12148.1 hypothetical protein LAESUDRAFT_720120 [Laetiporus sulphureus 93-53]